MSDNGVNPKCPNVDCEYHTNPLAPEDCFIISEIKSSFGKVFREKGANMVSCRKCGHIIGVASMS